MKISHHFLSLIALFLLTLPQARAADGSWNVDTDGNWSGSANWDPVAVPGGAGTAVNLTRDLPASTFVHVTIDTTPVTTGTLNISQGTTNPATAKIELKASGGGFLIMNNNGSEAQLTMGSSSAPPPVNAVLISAPIHMTDGGLVVRMYGANPRITGGISSDFTGTAVLRVAGGTSNLFFDGVISDGATSNQKVAILNDNTEGGTTYFENNNTFTGGLTVQHGFIKTNRNAGFGEGTITLGTGTSGVGQIGISNQGNYTYGNNIVVSSAATDATVKIMTLYTSTMSYTGNIEMQRALTVESNGTGASTTLSGAISGAGALTASSYAAANGLILTGSNSYSGTTTVTFGTLLINGDNSAATGAVTATGATATLGGTGTIGGAVTVKTSATLAAGGASTGILTVGNDVTLATTGIFSARINGTTAGTEYDRLVVTGVGSDFSLTGTNDLELTLGSYTAAANALFFLVDLDDDGSTLTGAFASLNGTTTDLSQGALFTVDGQDFHISYTGNRVGNTFLGGNDLVIQAVPEPTTGLLLVAGLTALAALRRRRVEAGFSR